MHQYTDCCRWSIAQQHKSNKVGLVLFHQKTQQLSIFRNKRVDLSEMFKFQT
jgi:hypothetical protein